MDGWNQNQLSASEDSKKKKYYNRANVRIEDFIHKNKDDINAKELRVLLPSMLQRLIYRERDVNRTKVKGIWDESNKPAGFPDDVKFRDPNNGERMSVKDMRKVFYYLQKKILESENGPNQANFQVATEHYGEKQSTDALQVDAIREECEDDVVFPLQQNEVDYTNSVKAAGFNPDVTLITKCEKFVQENLETLNHHVDKFKSMFQSNIPVIETMEEVLQDVVLPLINEAIAGDIFKLSKCCTALLDIIQRYVFLGPHSDPRNELNGIVVEYSMPVTEGKVPPVGEEVEIDSTYPKQDILVQNHQCGSQLSDMFMDESPLERTGEQDDVKGYFAYNGSLWRIPCATTQPYNLLKTFGVREMDNSTAVDQQTDEEEHRIVNTILDIEADYSTADQNHSIAGQPPDTKIPHTTRRHIMTDNAEKPLVNPKIPQTVIEIAEKPDGSPPPKRKRRVKGVTSTAVGIAGKKWMHQNKQAK